MITSYLQRNDQLQSFISRVFSTWEDSATPQRKSLRHQFEEDGYLHLERFVSESSLVHVDGLLEEWEDATINTWIERDLLEQDFKHLTHKEKLNASWISAGKPVHPATRENKLTVFDYRFHSFVCQEKLLGLVRNLLQCRRPVVLADSFYRVVLPNSQSSCIPWHQDSQCLQTKTDAQFLTIWIPLVDVSESNSCLEVAKFHHNNGMYKSRILPDYYIGLHEDDVDSLVDIKKIEMRRGDVLCLHQNLPHRSILNSSECTRWSLDIRYQNG